MGGGVFEVLNEASERMSWRGGGGGGGGERKAFNRVTCFVRKVGLPAAVSQYTQCDVSRSCS